MAYTAKNAAGGVVKFATVTNGNGDEETVHRVSQSALPTGAATETTLAAVRDRLDVPSSALFAFSDTAVGTSAAQLPSQACREVILLADPANTDAILIGGAGAQVWPLAPNDDLSLPVTNANVIGRKANSGIQTLYWIARP